jgi:hypothetical protein
MTHSAHGARHLVFAFATTVTGAVLASTPALAAPTPAREDTSTEAATPVGDENAPRLSLDARLGLAFEQDQGTPGWDGSLAFGVSALYHANILAVGVTAELGGELFDEEAQYLGALGGITAEATPWLHITTLVEGGVHLVQPAEGLQLFGTRRITGGETNTALPYVGLRLDPKLRFGNRNKFIIGPTLVARQDLTTTTQEFTTEYCSEGWFGGGYSCSTEDVSKPIGGLQVSATLSAGMEFGL